MAVHPSSPGKPQLWLSSGRIALGSFSPEELNKQLVGFRRIRGGRLLDRYDLYCLLRIAQIKAELCRRVRAISH